jgi:hypothetical protein
MSSLLRKFLLSVHNLGRSINNVSEPNCWWQIFPTDVRLLFISNPLRQLCPLISLSHLPQNLIHICRKSIWMRFLILLGDNNIICVCVDTCVISVETYKIKEICLGNKCSFYFPFKHLSLTLTLLKLQSDFKIHFVLVHVNQDQQVGKTCNNLTCRSFVEFPIWNASAIQFWLKYFVFLLCPSRLTLG